VKLTARLEIGQDAARQPAMGGMMLAVKPRAIRVLAPFAGDYHLMLSVSGGLWCAAIALFVLRYEAILCGR